MQKKCYAASKRASRVNIYKYLERSIRDYSLASPAHTINIGSGGVIAEVLEAAGVSCTSVDINPDKGPDIVASVEDLFMMEDDSVDGVFCMEVLEHVRQPFDAAREITRVLKPGGVIIGSTPFVLGIHDSPHDYFRYTKYGIRHLFSDLEELQILPRNNVFDAAKVLPLRLFAVGTEEEKRKLAWRWPLLGAANLVYSLAGRGIVNTDATTGYFFEFRKKTPQS